VVESFKPGAGGISDGQTASIMGENSRREERSCESIHTSAAQYHHHLVRV
jgi:hypothetical protein